MARSRAGDAIPETRSSRTTPMTRSTMPGTDGPKTIVLVDGENRRRLWEPFSDRYAGVYDTERDLYKNITGNKLVFEEINRPLNCRFAIVAARATALASCAGTLTNLGDAPLCCQLLDGLQNLLPANVDRAMQNRLQHAGRCLQEERAAADSGIGVYALSSVPVDRAEPSESLTANVSGRSGLDGDGICSAPAAGAFRGGRRRTGRRCARRARRLFRAGGMPTCRWRKP